MLDAAQILAFVFLLVLLRQARTLEIGEVRPHLTRRDLEKLVPFERLIK